MQSQDKIMLSPSRLSSAPYGPFGVDLSRDINQDSLDQSAIIKLSQEDKDSSPQPAKLEPVRPKSRFVPKKNVAYNHRKNDTVIAIKRWYQIRGWSLLYPLIMSLYLAVSELELDVRTMGYIFIALSCGYCFAFMKRFESQKNLTFILLNILCMLVILADFLFQYSFIGEKGWAATGSYQNCFKFDGDAHNKKLHDKLCHIFKAVYYLNSLMYLANLASFGVYLMATSKLMKLVDHVKDGNGYRTKLEDEVELEN